MVPLELVGVRVEVPANTPMVLLREQTGRQRLLPIYIGTPGGDVDPLRPRGVEPPRPLTHDLFIQTLDRARGRAASRSSSPRCATTRTSPSCTCGAPTASVTVMSSRPSDAIALAVRCDAPLFASEELLDEVGQEPTPEPEEEAEEISTSSATSSSTSTPKTSPADRSSSPAAARP